MKRTKPIPKRAIISLDWKERLDDELVNAALQYVGGHAMLTPIETLNDQYGYIVHRVNDKISKSFARMLSDISYEIYDPSGQYTKKQIEEMKVLFKKILYVP